MSRATGLLVAGIGVLVFGLGWMAGLAGLRSLGPAFALMTVNTSLCFVAVGLALYLAEGVGAAGARWPSRLLAAIALLVSGVSLGADLLGLPLPLDDVLIHDPNPQGNRFPGRMSPATAMGFVLASCSLLGYRPRSGALSMTHTLGGLVLLDGAVALTGYAYGVEELYQVTPFRSMAVHTATAFVIAGIGLVALPPGGWLVQLWRGPGLQGQMVRRLLPAALVPLLLGWIVSRGLGAHLYPPSFALVLAGLSSTSVLVATVAWTARLLARLEAERVRVLERAASDRDDFMAMLGHELRNPLAVIANATVIIEDNCADSKVLPALAALNRQVPHIVKLVDDLLDVSRIIQAKVRIAREPIDILTSLRDAIHDHEVEATAKQIALTLRCPSDRVSMLGDPGRLYQVFDNLLSNAIAFTDPGGHVDVIVVDADPERVRVHVVDDGIGMSPEAIEIMFEPFRQGPQALDRPRGGLGLGLSLVRGIVELHGGSIAARSGGTSRGTEISIGLPRGLTVGVAATDPRCATDFDRHEPDHREPY